MRNTPAALIVSAVILVVAHGPGIGLQGRQTYLFAGPPRCDAAGNLFFIPGQIREGDVQRLNEIVRISADGKRTITDVTTLMGAKMADLSTNGITTDPSGRLYVLTRLGTGESSRQQILSISDSLDPITVDPAAIAVDQIAAFASGDLLLVGDAPLTGKLRMVVQPSDRGRLREVALPGSISESRSEEAGVERSRILMASSATGMDEIFVVRSRSTRGYTIASSGQVTGEFAVPPPPLPDVSLVDIRVSGQRLAAIFRQDGRGGNWVVAYDFLTGTNARTYGPVPNLITCYWSSPRDRFTLLSTLKGEWKLVAAEAL